MSNAVIRPHELAELCKAGKTIDLIDVRTPVEYRNVYLEIARNVPLDQLDPMALTHARNSSANAPLYLICRSGSRGQLACEKFIKAGFSNVFNVEGGTIACVEAGLPVIRGKEAISLERQVRIAAGSLVLLGAALGWFVHPAFIGLSAFVGTGLFILRTHRYLWDGDDPGQNAVEPMPAGIVPPLRAATPSIKEYHHEITDCWRRGWWRFRSRSRTSTFRRRPNRSV